MIRTRNVYSRAATCLAIVMLASACAWQPPTSDLAVPSRPAADSAARFASPRAPFAAPDDDPFHAQATPAELAATAPGTVLRYRRIAAQAYYFFDVNARAWQIAYRTADGDGTPQVNVATILVPDHPRPRLLSYQVAYDALTRRCAPSYEVLSGSMVEHMLMNKALQRGWIVVVPDYEGPETQFLAGRNSAHGVLDAIRATRAFLPDAWVNTDTPVALWGYSGGAFASLWAAEIAANYAPEIPLVGVAAGGPPADLAGSAEAVDGGLFAGMYFAAVVGLSRAYDAIDTDRLLNEAGRKMFADVGDSCIGQELAWVKDPVLSGYAFDDMQDYTTVDNLLAVPAVKKVIADNQLGQQGFAAPLFYYHAFFDQVTPRDDAKTLAGTYCAAGVPAVRFDYALGEHISAALTQASSAVDYLADRFDGQPPPNDCEALLPYADPAP
ncbi:lipase [Salinisphaera sp. S4-8]|uniref:lipase family protein n=1 Tax=Salinisphaera sp. S4-8 TaxID=633357 RepID=UPI003341C5E4